MFEEIRALFAIDGNRGFSQKEVLEACDQYGNLPEVLKQYYLQLGKDIPLNRQQNFLRRPKELIDAGDYLIFYLENQNVARWAIKKSEMGKDNPPVYCSMEDPHFQLECETLYDFLCAMAGFQAASWGLPCCSEEFYYLEEDQLSQIAEHYEKKPYALHEWLDITFYGNQKDEVICVFEGDHMLYASSDRKHFEEMEAFMESLDLELL